MRCCIGSQASDDVVIGLEKICYAREKRVYVGFCAKFLFGDGLRRCVYRKPKGLVCLDVLESSSQAETHQDEFERSIAEVSHANVVRPNVEMYKSPLMHLMQATAASHSADLEQDLEHGLCGPRQTDARICK